MKWTIKGLMRAMSVCLCLAVLPCSARARTYYRESIELVTVQADVILRGTIAEIVPIGTSEDRSGYFRHKMIIHVTETLKGPKADRISIALQSVDIKMPKWQEFKTEVLFSLKSMDGDRLPCPFVLLPSFGESAIELDGEGPGVVNMDFRVLKAKADILKAAREGVAAAPPGGVKALCRLEPPTSSDIGWINQAFSQLRVVVPVDARLEQRGEKWSKLDSIEYRYLAVSALAWFPSDRNVVILRRLLLDDLHVDHPDGKGGKTLHYPVRERAYWLLKKWGVKVEEPAYQVYVPGNGPLASLETDSWVDVQGHEALPTLS